MQLEDIAQGLRLEGVIPHEVVEVVHAQFHNSDAVEVLYKTLGGTFDQRVIFREQQDSISKASSDTRPFDARSADFKLAAEAQRIKYAGLHDPMVAVATSEVRPLPHQIRAVYEELLPRTPLRFLLADDPGAGKTVMAGMLVKELILREDVKRCLIVTPGGLVDQWQDELWTKFGLDFEIFRPDDHPPSAGSNPFARSPFLLARMDQLSRNDNLKQLLEESTWDLTIVDEAHRMGAQYYGKKIKTTKRFQLGELLGTISRHFLLMTATPHSGKEADFQLFLSLLDRDRFYGKRTKAVETSDIMRRMIKEDLLTFEGKPLFPERYAQSVAYELTHLEKLLYEQVTDYVRNGMNRAEKLDGKRKSSVGFAMTVLQRRLASSPEAILRSLIRRRDRLAARSEAAQDSLFQKPPVPDLSDIDSGELPDAQIEELEERLADSATAAKTVGELEAEVIELNDLCDVAQRVRAAGDDRKWRELKKIIESIETDFPDANGAPRKLIIFTEHRDTLRYLSERIGQIIAEGEAVVQIHGGVGRSERREITAKFTADPKCRILLATDAAGEGLNLQAAHLMVNYDLPWNPNRLEQRFGRIHRIGQTEVCRLWNLVAAETREGQVFSTLLNKLEEQRSAFGGKVFDVLGTAFHDVSLRELLVEAVRFGDQQEVKARMKKVIDTSVAHGLEELVAESSLATDRLTPNELATIKSGMDDAKARRLQPYHVESTFRQAFEQLGGVMKMRGKGRYEITSVPASLRDGQYGNVAATYERVTFDMGHITAEDQIDAQFLAPGQALHDAVVAQTLKERGSALERGTIFVSKRVQEPQLLVGVVETITDGSDEVVAERFRNVYVNSRGGVSDAGPSPYLDFEGDAFDRAQPATLTWLSSAEERVKGWLIGTSLQQFLHEVQPRRKQALARERKLVDERLSSEIERLREETAVLPLELDHVEGPSKPDSVMKQIEELEHRRSERLRRIDKQAELSAKPPRTVFSALVIPSDEPNAITNGHRVDDRLISLVIQQECSIGRTAHRVESSYAGWDVVSFRNSEPSLRLCIKRKPTSGSTLWVSHNELIAGKNCGKDFRWVLCNEVGGNVEIRYLESLGAAAVPRSLSDDGLDLAWERLWDRAKNPF